MLVLHNVRLKPLIVRKKIREPSIVTKVLLNVMLKMVQCEDETIKFLKK